MNTTTERVLNYLLVEDNDNHAQIIELCLRQEELPHECRHVSSGTGCLRYLGGEEPFADRTRYPYPDVVLLDIRMPGTLNGLQTLQAIRADSRHRSLVVMMLTTSDRDTDISRAYELGANGYIVKSDDTSKMIEKLLQMRWSFGSLIEVPKRQPDIGHAQDTETKGLPSIEVLSLLESDEDTALRLLISSYRSNRKSFVELLHHLERLTPARFASLVHRFCLQQRHLFAGAQDVDWDFIRQVVMGKLPQYLSPEQMTGMVAGIAAVMEGKVWNDSDMPSLHAWQGFCQAYLSQSRFSSSAKDRAH
ncbi:MAG: response regulator [Thermoguttaceae bacterium]